MVPIQGQFTRRLKMNTSPSVIALRDRLQTVLAGVNVLIDTYKDIINSDETETSQLRDYCFNGLGKLHRQKKLLEKHITKMSVQHGVAPKDASGSEKSHDNPSHKK